MSRSERSVQSRFSIQDPYTPGGYSHRTYAAVASLGQLDLTDISLPLQEVRRFLLARSEARFAMHPALFEATVASVFSDLGFNATVTAYSGDGGIDVILIGSDDIPIGVQVKRWRNRVKVEQIRELIGALVVAGHTQGVFVTTSSYQSGANSVVKKASAIGISITLVDGVRFLDTLKLAQLTSISNYDVSGPPFITASLEVLSYNDGGCNSPQRFVWSD